MTPFSGDADLYVSLNASQRPTMYNHDYKSIASQGSDHITIESSDPQWKASSCNDPSKVSGSSASLLVAPLAI